MASTTRSTGTAAVRVQAFLIRASGLLRVIQLSVGASFLPGNMVGGRSPAVIVGAFVVAVGWSVALFSVALRKRRMPCIWIVADAALALLWLLLLPQACGSACSTGSIPWVVPLAMSSATLAAFFAPIPLVVPVVAAIATAIITTDGIRQPGTANPFGQTPVNAYFLIGFSALAWVVAKLLRTAASEANEATGQAMEARARVAAEQARFDERTRQYDVLHHTVLATLTKIARGSLDHRADEVRALCARDADFLRGLLTGGADETPGDFTAALAGVVRDEQAMGLLVHSQFHALPQHVPATVAAMLIGVAREALTNVAKHAETGEAWLTAVGERDGVALSVVDRGVGFDAGSITFGRGMVRELRHVVIEAGGTVTVTSNPGEGTVVEVRWSP